MKRIPVVVLAVFLVASVPVLAPVALRAAPVPEIVMSSYGGQLDEPFRWFLADPFEQRTGARVTLVPSQSLEVIAKIKASPTSPPFDVILLDEGPHLQAAADGIVQRLDEKTVPNMAQVYPAYRKVTHGFGVPQAYSVVGLAYNTKRVKTPPTSWRDLFNPEFKGQVGTVNLNSSLGVAFLVMLAKLYGGGEANIEPGFAAYKALMSNIALATVMSIEFEPIGKKDGIKLVARGSDVMPNYLRLCTVTSPCLRSVVLAYTPTASSTTTRRPITIFHLRFTDTRSVSFCHPL